MWPPWVKTRTTTTATTTAATTSTSISASASTATSPRLSFSSPSLKDIQTLLLDDSPSPPATTGSTSPSIRVFHRVRVAAAALRALRSPAGGGGCGDGDRRVVLYFTSLHVVRSTYDDCRAVRAILRGLRAAVDERDLAMDPRFLPELASLLRGRGVRLPQVFVGGRHLGGAEEIRRLHESGDLRRLVAGAAASISGGCGRCSGERFVLCGGCNGSHKRYSHKGGGGFRSCAACNENGLVRCPDCCSLAV